jgi:hypothetical protein
MNAVARYALTASVVASAVGGVVLCLLVLKYGLSPPEEDEPINISHRRFFMTRLGHAVAAACLATSAVLTVLALAVGANRAPEAAGPPPALNQEELRGLEGRLAAVEEAVRRIGRSIDAALGPGGAGPPSLPPADRGRR